MHYGFLKPLMMGLHVLLAWVELSERLVEILTPPKAPKRAGPILDNVIELFKREQRTEWSASDVLAALSAEGKTAAPKKVYSALTYLSDMKILRRVGYGRYLIEGGGLLITHDKGGD